MGNTDAKTENQAQSEAMEIVEDEEAKQLRLEKEATASVISGTSAVRMLEVLY